MTIGGLQKLTLTDFPGRLSAIIFTRGCNFRCPYCHNPELVDPLRYVEPLSEEEVFSFLQARIGELDGVVVTGGEPTIHSDLARLLRKLKRLGFSVKLDTNGSAPEMISQLIADSLLDYVAIDIKASADSYERAAGVTVDTAAVRSCVERVVSAGLPHEVRMTVVDPLMSLRCAQGVAQMARGCKLFFVQPFQPSKSLDPGLLALPRPSVEELDRIRTALLELGLPAVLR
jgi:pyruvate formate lyase activating enzyme